MSWQPELEMFVWFILSIAYLLLIWFNASRTTCYPITLAAGQVISAATSAMFQSVAAPSL